MCIRDRSNGLKDGSAPWRRVAFYWQSSGLLPAMAFKAGASDCSYAAMSLSYPGLGCRGFVIDNPWSAAFISWVMQRAGVPGDVYKRQGLLHGEDFIRK